MFVVLTKRCYSCHGILEAGPLLLLPRSVGRPHVVCPRCGRITRLSACVALAAALVGLPCAGVAVAVCRAFAIWLVNQPPDAVPIALVVAVACAVWLLGYLAFATGCYVLSGIWKLVCGAH